MYKLKYFSSSNMLFATGHMTVIWSYVSENEKKKL